MSLLASLSGQSLASAEAEAAARFGLTDDQRKRVVVGSPMKLESNITVFEDRGVSGQWRVEYVDEDGGCYVTIFAGPAAEHRAREYQQALVTGRLSTNKPGRALV